MMWAAAGAAQGPVLRDIHVPPTPAWWPPAPGWWLLAAVALVAMAAACWLWRKRRHRRELERRVLSEVDALAAQWRDRPQQLAAGLHQLLRRAASRIDGRSATCRGDAWRQLLASVKTDDATVAALMSLDMAMYRPHAAFDADEAVAATRRWLQAAWRQRKPASRRASIAATVPGDAHA